MADGEANAMGAWDVADANRDRAVRRLGRVKSEPCISAARTPIQPGGELVLLLHVMGESGRHCGPPLDRPFTVYGVLEGV
jgi:hypothetical protein